MIFSRYSFTLACVSTHKWFAAIIFIIFAAVSSHAFSDQSEKPNVVIFYTDDQGTLDAGCYGSKDLHTPNMDRLAKNGVRFTQAYAHTVCCPSRAAFLTGRHPQRSGINNWTQGNMNGPDGLNMSLAEITFAEAFKESGYRTALFGKWHVGSHRNHGPMKQGFDEFFGIRNGFIDNYNHYFLHGKGYHDLYEGTTEVFKKGSYFPELITDRALSFIEKNREAPFLLYLGFNIPHYPEQALPEHTAIYQGLDMPRRSYAAMITTTDHYMGQVLEKLSQLGLTENTIVIFQSDNGHSAENGLNIQYEDHSSGHPKGHYYLAHGGGGNTGKWIGAKGTFLEGGIRVPAVVSWPAKLPKGIVRDQIITIMDWYPSLLEWCGIKKPDVVLDGHSLQPVIHSAEAPAAHEVLHFQWRNSWAVRKGDWKLIGNKQGKPKNEMRYTLHHLTDENPEVTDYAEEKPARVQELIALHESWIRNLDKGQ
ncbi:sulfatase-like hydrolase/transferase [Akkermansiaceae bacterium]|nr:sulfatase-like hydrolase/transferase [Akkermansiaceae bacterium]MDA7540459.1 sulfatase-like hydrolase/transferase [bacterium]MDA7522329.1 sulfatase-like hydrolase/transferase [Akkermansiaceae bacterium]MDA7539514.1 sulfatase-like hydrolase/transferase [Akkermansiaceae bacterium]MDA7612207.1 sulfatase-like hydrolase/transferase [bacterium]